MKPLTLLLTMLLSTSAFAQRGPFSVAGIMAQPGEMASGLIEVPRGVDEGTQIPVTVIHGKNAGPVITFVAGTHGYEYTPILALQRLRSRVNAENLSGTVIFVHVANMPSFLKRTIYYSPIDGKNLNRVFPGTKDGTSSERIAYAITSEVIEKSEYVIDIHCGDGNESLRPYTYWINSGNGRVDTPARQMAMAFGLDHIIIDRSRPADPAASVYLSNTAITRGKPALTVESGFLGQLDHDSIQKIETGVFNLLRHLKMLPGEVRGVENPIWLDPTQVITSEASGIFYPMVERGQSITRGTVLGVVTDFFGKRLSEVRAPFSGVVLYVVATPPVSKGEPLAMIGAPRN